MVALVFLMSVLFFRMSAWGFLRVFVAGTVNSVENCIVKWDPLLEYPATDSIYILTRMRRNKVNLLF